MERLPSYIPHITKPGGGRSASSGEWVPEDDNLELCLNCPLPVEYCLGNCEGKVNTAAWEKAKKKEEFFMDARRGMSRQLLKAKYSVTDTVLYKWYREAVPTSSEPPEAPENPTSPSRSSDTPKGKRNTKQKGAKP